MCLAFPAVECAAGLSASNPLADGAYSLYIRELMRSLPPSQLRVFTEEAFLREPSRAIGEAVGFLTSPLPGEGGLRPGATEEAATRVAAAAQKAEANVFVSISEGKADDTVATGIQAAARNAARARRAVRNTPAADVAALRAFYEEYDAELVQLMDGEQKFAWSSAGVA